MKLTQEQEAIFDSIMVQPNGLYILTETPRSGKSFFIKYIIQYFQSEGQKVLLLETTGVAAGWLSRTSILTLAMVRLFYVMS
jgi:hypothetical protein